MDIREGEVVFIQLFIMFVQKLTFMQVKLVKCQKYNDSIAGPK